jgi:hypothetical protein
VPDLGNKKLGVRQNEQKLTFAGVVIRACAVMLRKIGDAAAKR